MRVASRVDAGSLLEREDELAEISRCLADARAGGGALTLLEGPAGIGKTRLLLEAQRAARAAGMTVLRAHGSELERDFPYGVVRQLVEPSLAARTDAERAELLSGAAALAAPLFAVEPELRAGAPGTAALLPSAERPGAVLHGLYWLFAALAAREPVLVAVDDAHWADRGSLRFFCYLLARLEELPLAMLVAARSGEAEAEPELLGRLAVSPRAILVRPRALSRHATAELIGEGLGTDPEERFVDACQAVTGGLPFLVRELVRQLAADAIEPTAAESEHVRALAPGTVGRMMLVRLRGLAPGAVALARAVSVLDADAELRRVGALAGVGDPGPIADRLVAAGIVAAGRPLAFVHPIVRSAIYRDTPASERARMHAAAASMLATEQAPPDRVSSHLLLTEPSADVAVVERLRAAARDALSAGAADSAVAYLVRALAEPPPADARSGLLLELGVAASHAGAPDAAKHLHDAVELAEGSHELLAGTLALGRTLMNSGRNREALDVFRRASGRVAGHSAHDELVLEGALLGAAQLERSGAELAADLAGRLRRRVEAQDAAPASVFGPLAAAALLANEPAEHVAELAHRALGDGERVLPEAVDRPPFFYFATHTLTLTERFDDARRLYDLTIADARTLGSALHFVMASAFRAALEYRVGQVADAEADARQALGADPARAPPAWAAVAAATLADALRERGELDQADAELARGWPGRQYAGMLTYSDLLCARGRLRLAQTRPADALEDLLAAGRLLQELHARSPAYASWRSDAARAALALEDRGLARRLTAEELELARAFGAPRAVAVALRAAGVVEGGQRGLGLLRDAVSVLAGSPAALERASALADLGSALRRAGRRSDAREPLREALALAHRCGAGALAGHARSELLASGARPRRIMRRGVESLTPSERRVAQMASSGMTNREIAQALFVTLRTVEIHLTHSYQKLEISSRRELAAALRG